MPSKTRNYAAEYARRKLAAQQRGFKSEREEKQTRRLFYERTRIPPRAVRVGYFPGTDKQLDAFVRQSQVQGMPLRTAILQYRRRGNNQRLSREQVRDLQVDLFDIDYDETYYE